MKQNYKTDCIAVLKEIAKKYPNQLLSSHLTLAFADYVNIEGLSDKEVYYLLEKYKCVKELDLGIHSTSTKKDLDEIIAGAENLNVEDLMDEEDEY